MTTKPVPLLNLDNCVGSLRELLTENPPARERWIHVAVRVERDDKGEVREPANVDRREIPIFDGKKLWHWRNESLRDLWRGDQPAPSFGATPRGYDLCFITLEQQVIEFCHTFGDRRDAELEEIFSTLRRRPDGKSLGYAHDYLWQATAFLLGSAPLSQGEAEAILGRLERSCRTFRTGPGSRNYIANIRAVYR